MRINEDTKTFKLFNALRNGETITPAQAEKRFGIKNISAEASRIRSHGFAVYANSRTAGNGVRVTEYVLGSPQPQGSGRWLQSTGHGPGLISLILSPGSLWFNKPGAMPGFCLTANPRSSIIVSC